MFSRKRKWALCDILLVTFLLFVLRSKLVLGQYENYEGPLPYRQESLDATDLPCGSEVQVQAGEKYIFDSKSAVKYESSQYAAENYEGQNYGPTRRKRAAPSSLAKVNRENPGQTNTNPGKINENPGKPINQIKKPNPVKTGARQDAKLGKVNSKPDKQKQDSNIKKSDRKEQTSELAGRSYNGGNSYSYGQGSYSQNSGGSNYGGHRYGGGYQGGNYGYGNAYPGKPIVCEWTFFAGDDCSLESHIIKFKPGDMDCYKQQLVISDNYTDFRMCGYQKLYPGFRAETAVLYIKYWRQPYTYRHVFKGYVTCVGRAQRPTFNYTETYEYVPQTASSTLTHSHSSQTSSHTGSLTNEKNLAVSTAHLLDNLGLNKMEGVVVESGNSGLAEKVVFQIKEEDIKTVKDEENDQVFTAAQVQEMIKKAMLKQAQKVSSFNPNSQIEVDIEETQIQTHDTHQHSGNIQTVLEEVVVHTHDSNLPQDELSSADELIANLEHHQVKNLLHDHSVVNDVELDGAEILMNEAKQDLEEASMAQQLPEEVSKFEDAQIKLKQAEELLSEMSASHNAQVEDVVIEVANSQLESPQEAEVVQVDTVNIVEEEPVVTETAFETGDVVHESVVVVETEKESKPQSHFQSLLNEAKEVKTQSLHERLLAQSPLQEENPSVVVSQTNTQNSSPNVVFSSFPDPSHISQVSETVYTPSSTETSPYIIPPYTPSLPTSPPGPSYYPYPVQSIYPPNYPVTVIDPYAQIEPYSSFHPIDYNHNASPLLVPHTTSDLSYPISSTNYYYPSLPPYSQYANPLYGAPFVSSENEHEQIAGRSHEDTGYSATSRKVPRPRITPPPQQYAPPEPMYNPEPIYNPEPVYSPEPYGMPPPSYPPPSLPPNPYQPQPGGYQLVVASPVDPNIHYVVTCQLPYPYPCTPIHSLSANPPPPPPPAQPQEPMPGIYGR